MINKALARLLEIYQKIKSLLFGVCGYMLSVMPDSIRRMALLLINKSHTRQAGEVFDDIYLCAKWGRDVDGFGTSGKGSHEEETIRPYISLVRETIESLGLRSIVDLGCGDFNVGSRIACCVDEYIACDVSDVVLDRNRHRHHKSENVDFKKIDLIDDQLPTADLAICRQVLQHLSNSDICSFVSNLNAQKPYKYLLLTEHIPSILDFKPNIDKPQGHTTRLLFRSGVVLDASPFELNCLWSKRMLSTRSESYGCPGIILTTLYKL